jgi:hypothetical protein
MNAIKIAQGETDSLTGTATEEVPYLVEISTTAQNEFVLIGKSERRIKSHGQRYYDGDRARLTAHAGETLYCYSPNSDAKVEIRPEGFDVDLFPRRSVYEIERVDQLDTVTDVTQIQDVANVQTQESKDSLTADEHATSGTSAEQLAANAVPNGVEVLIQADYANADSVFVGDADTQSMEIKPGGKLTLRLSDTSAAYIQTPNAGDSVNILFEG